MSAPLVSVIMPTRNRSGLLPFAVRSALDQTLSDFELLLIDDASDDDTGAVAESFSDSRIVYLREAVRRGGAGARNDAIGRSRGEFVAFLDDDDEWFPDKLRLQVDLLRREGPGVGVVYCSYPVVDRVSGKVLGRKVASDRGDLRRKLLTRNVVGASSCVVVRRSCLEKSGLFDEELPSYHDYDLWIRLSRETAFDFVEQDLMRYHIHPNKIWSDLDALSRGIERMLKKHGASREVRRNLAEHSLGLGVRYCSRGEMAKGRHALTRSIRLAPTALRPYLNWALSHLGARVFRGVHDAKNAVSGPSGPRPAPVAAAPRNS